MPSLIKPDSRPETAPITIRERSGRKRAITLWSRAAAFRGQASWVMGQRAKVTWYAGNPVGTMQLGGPTFDFPTTLVGIWRDRYLGDESTPLVEVSGFAPPATAEDLEKCFRELIRAGSDLDVQYSHWRRLGVLKQFSAKPDRTEDVHWEAEFMWYADGETTAPRRALLPLSFEPDVIKGKLSALSDHATFNPIDTLQAFEAKIFQAIADLEGRVTDLLEQGRVLAGALTLPARVVQSVRASATSIAYLAGQLIEEVASTPYTYAQVVDDVGSVLKAEAWRREASFLAGQLRASVLAAADALEERQEPDGVRVVVVDGSGSLRNVALREYGTADAWGELADANGFDGPFVEPGTEIFVPPRRIATMSTV